jgi:hypothetical protein
MAIYYELENCNRKGTILNCIEYYQYSKEDKCSVIGKTTILHTKKLTKIGAKRMLKDKEGEVTIVRIDTIPNMGN